MRFRCSIFVLTYHKLYRMHIKNISWISFIIIIISSCSRSAPHISLGCEENKVGNSIIRWEVTPQLDGYVRVYAGNTPNDIVEDIPVGMANISDQRLVIINNDPTIRQYYSIVFNNEKRIKVASRNINITNVYNFRDLGGYRVYPLDKGGKWGKVYRTGNLDAIDSCGIARLQNLKIKTIVDLRPTKEQNVNGLLKDHFNLISIPIFSKDANQLLALIKQKKINRGELTTYMKSVYTRLIKDYKEEYKEVFKLLLDEKNYPIVFQCAVGKEQSGIVSYLLLSALGINQETIKLDYLRTNSFIDMSGASQYATSLSAGGQEALTALLLAQEEYLDAAIHEIESSYGDVNSFIIEGLGIANSELEKLRTMLLE